MYLSSREMEYHTMTTRTRASVARSFQPAGRTHGRAGSRNREAQPQATFSAASAGAPARPAHSRPSPGPSSPAQGLDPSVSAVLQDEDRGPWLRVGPSPTPCFWGAHPAGWGAPGEYSRDLLIMFLRCQGSWGELSSRLPRAT